MMKPSKSKSDVTALMADLAVFHVAVLSRVVTIFLSIISNIIVPDHDAEGVSYFAPEIYLNPSTLRHRILQTFTRWDAAHFLNIASEGYTQDYQWAFFPGYPWLLSIFKSYVPWPYGVSHEEALVISAIWVSNAAFVLAAVGLHRLGRAAAVRRTTPTTATKTKTATATATAATNKLIGWIFCGLFLALHAIW